MLKLTYSLHILKLLLHHLSVFAFYGLVSGPSHVSDLRDLKHLLAVNLNLVELVRVPPVYGVGRRPVILCARVEMRAVRDRGLDVGRLRLVVVGREDLCEGITDLDAAVEADTLVDGAIEGHEVARVVVVVPGHGGAVKVLEPRGDRLPRIACRVEAMIIVGPEPEALGILADSAVLIGLMIIDPLNQVVKDLRANLILVLDVLLV